MKIDPNSNADLSAQIAKAIRDAIVAGDLIVDERLPSEAELAEHFDVSRPTVREALKRLAAQSLIRTQRGAFGGAFVNRLSYREAYNQQITTSTLLLSMNGRQLRRGLRGALRHGTGLCAAGRPARRSADHLATMRAEITASGPAGPHR
jgi:GntR family transcriptional repressor for pyruvate dehydrogenase complex